MKWSPLIHHQSLICSLLQPLTETPTPHLRSYAPIFQLFTGQRPKIFLKLGRQAHGHVLLRGLNPSAFLGAKMVAMYASLGDLNSAILVFNRISDPSPLLFNSIIRAYTLNGLFENSIQTFSRMNLIGLAADYFTYPFVLKSCAELLLFGLGRCVHGHSLRAGLAFDMYFGTSLIHMYINCSDLGDAQLVFDELPMRDVASWNALIAGYMRDGMIQFAEELFEQMTDRNIVSWTAMISGYTQNGMGEQALSLFNEMLKSSSEIKPNWVTVMSVLPACTHSAVLGQGRRIHEFARDIGMCSNPSVLTAIAAMYAKCGCLGDALSCFDEIHPNKRSLVTWNAMITAYASHGRGIEAVSTFKDMLRAGVRPDPVSFTGLLSGCSHSGLVDIGLKYFHTMGSVYSVEPRHEHYACVVDLLSRAGRLLEARNIICRMLVTPGPSIWGALLAGCKKYRNLELAVIAARKLFILEPENSGNYVLLSNMYAEAGMWGEVDKLRAALKSKGMKKNPGSSWIEVHGKAHLFLGGGTSHPQSSQIYMFLETLPQKIRAAGYAPDTSFVLHDVSEEEKEGNLNTHSEKLAVAFALLNTGPDTVLRVTKNLRICGDCHAVMKFISEIYRREIIVRDVNRFHHFRDGSCSCHDYW